MVTQVITPAALSSDPAEALPNRLKVLAWGNNPNANQRKVHVGERFLQAMAATAYPYLKIPLDFEHNTVKGMPAYEESKEPRDVAGYATVEVIPGEGVFLNVTRWTPKGRMAASSLKIYPPAPTRTRMEMLWLCQASLSAVLGLFRGSSLCRAL